MLAMGKKSVTITDIAREVKFSVSTVSKAFSNSTDISETAKTQILKRAIEMGYSFGKKTSKTKGKLAVLVSGLDVVDSNTFEYQMLFGFRVAASEKGYEIVTVNKPITPDWSFYDNVLSNDYEGAFILRTDYYNRDDEFNKSDLPVVMFDHYIEAPRTAYIGCDNETGISLAINHLVSLGHKKIAFYGGTPMILVSVARRNGFINGLRNNGLPVHPELIFESNFGFDYSSTIIPQIIEHGATAIVCASDMLAFYATQTLEKMNISVPSDISIVGFDNVPLGEEMSPKLTTISQNSYEIGKGGFYVLESLMNGVAISRLLYRPSLIVRESTCPPKKIK